MIAKPTTEQILNECSRELMEVVLPAVGDETVKVSVMMMGLVLRNAAVRAAHEIAWMSEEIAELEAFPRNHVDREAAPERPQRLHLDDVVERYRQASEAFALALEAAVAASDDELTRQGEALLARRVEHEQEILCGWSPVGR
jgi:hypothetical protein